MLRAISLGIVILLTSSGVAAQTRGGLQPASMAQVARPPAGSGSPARPTLIQRIRGAVRGAIAGFRLGAFRASAARRQSSGANPRARMIGLPDVRQANDYTCGAASLQSILRYFGKGDDGGEEELAQRLGTTPENGTTPSAIVRVAREHGLTATIREGMTLGDLESYVERGVPVIVDYQAWSESANPDYSNDWENGHYSVVVGIDHEKVYLEDPSILGARGTVSREEFLARWHDEDEGRRYHRMGIAISSPDGAQFQTRMRRTVPTE